MAISTHLGRALLTRRPIVPFAVFGTLAILILGHLTSLGVAGVGAGLVITFAALLLFAHRMAPLAFLGLGGGTILAVATVSSHVGPATQFRSAMTNPTEITIALTDDVRVGGGAWVRAEGWALTVRNRSGAQAPAQGRIQLWWSRTPADRTGRYLSGQQVSGRVRSWRPADPGETARVFLVGAPSPVSSHTALQRWRSMLFESARRRLRRADETVNALVLALTLADKTDLDQRLSAAFREAGASHALALSGMHLGILAAMASFLVRPLVGRRWGTRIVLPILVAYVITIGMLASLVRAIVGAVLVWITRELDVRPHPVTLIAAAILPILFWFPRMVADVGLWLSFAALIGLVSLGPPVAEALARWLPPWIAVAVGSSWAAFVATAPISLSVFGAVYPAGILAAAPMGLAITLFAWTALIAIVTATVPWIGWWAVRALTFQYSLLQWGAEWSRCLNPAPWGILLVALPGLALLYHRVRIRRTTIPTRD